MATISEVAWFPTRTGTCPCCGRTPIKIGRLNIEGCEEERCIDCYFNPASPEEIATWEPDSLKDGEKR